MHRHPVSTRKGLKVRNHILVLFYFQDSWFNISLGREATILHSNPGILVFKAESVFLEVSSSCSFKIGYDH